MNPVADAYLSACRAEVKALKVGNVHRFRDGHRMTVADFYKAAAASAPHVARTGAPLGARVREAVEASLKAVGQNANLGIVLLCAPLAMAHEKRAPIGEILEGLDSQDSEEVYAAIRAANPGGLGRAREHDVSGAAPARLLDAMAAAADRDLVARQYAEAFDDVLESRLPATPGGLFWRAAALHLTALAAHPDSHILRKHGPGPARLVQDAALRLIARGAGSDPRAFRRALMRLDARLKALRINPGSTADFVTAVLFQERLRNLRDLR